MPSNKSDSTEKSQKDESTRKSAPADNRRTGRVSSTRSTKQDAEFKKRSAAAKKGAKSRKQKAKKGEAKSAPRAASGKEVPINAHPFAPESKVEVYRAVDVDVQRRSNRPPVGTPVTTATVTKAGDLTIQSSKLEAGQYVAVAKLDSDAAGSTNRVTDADEDYYAYVGFGKVTDEQREKFGAMTGLHGGKSS